MDIGTEHWEAPREPDSARVFLEGVAWKVLTVSKACAREKTRGQFWGGRRKGEEAAMMFKNSSSVKDPRASQSKREWISPSSDADTLAPNPSLVAILIQVLASISRLPTAS